MIEQRNTGTDDLRDRDTDDLRDRDTDDLIDTDGLEDRSNGEFGANGGEHCASFF